jgi:hypothetical protein
MKKILQIVLLAFSTIPTWSQTCNVPVLKTQADVDGFSASYPGCTVVNGDLQIVSSTITNLDGLRGITRITGSLKINYNPNLKSILGLSSLAQIDASVNIADNDSLLTLDGLEHLVSLLGSISVVFNERLTSLEGLRGLTKIFTNMSIGSNPALISLNGLHNVSRVRGSVSIASNDKLVDLNGLRRLKEINWWSYIGNNKSLKNLKGLERLETAQGGLEITGNNALTSISELAQLQTTSQMIIKNNPLLSDCAIKIVCIRAAFGDITISGNAAGCTSNYEVRTSNNCMPQTLVRINAGGPAFTTATQKLFVADQYYAGIDRTSSIASVDILNTTNDVLYRSGRCSPSFSYNIPVVNDQVNVILHFAETYFGAPGKKGGVGSRQFHVNMEGSRKLTNYDIFAAAGGALRSVALTIPVTVTDGMLNIDFLTGAADMPRVSAIEVLASPNLIPVEDAMVNLGVPSYINYGLSDDLYVRQVPSGNSPNGTWHSYLKFQLPAGKAAITSAKLRIYGHNYDTYGNNPDNSQNIAIHAYGVNTDSWTEQAITGDNAPSASTASLGYVEVNDVLKYYEIDVTSYVNAQRQSGDQIVSLMLDNSTNQSTLVKFQSREGGANPPKLIYQTTNIVQTTNNVARLGQEEVLTEAREKQQSTVSPNPVKDQFTVSLSPEHVGPITFEIVNAVGSSRTIPTPQNAAPGENSAVNIAGQSFDTGIYLLKIKSDAFTEVVKMLVSE